MSATYQHEALAVSGGEGRVRALARARRHSTLVRRLRVLLPALAVVLVVAALLPGAAMLTHLGPVRVEKISIEDGALKIEKPRLSGVTGAHQAYEVSAVSAQQDIGKPHLVRLTGVSAAIEEARGGLTRVDAARGLFDTRNETLRLDQRVTVRWAGGQTMRLRSVMITMKSGTIVSNQPVEVDLLNGMLRADAMRVENRGELIIFSGNAKLDFRPDGAGLTAARAAAATPLRTGDGQETAR